MTSLPTQYAYLQHEPGPRILLEALALYGVKEMAGEANNPTILNWARELGGWIGSWYTQDSVPWCGLFIGLVAQRAGFPFGQKALGAKDWLLWGDPQTTAMLGDVLVFQRPGGGHVGLYVGEDAAAYHVLGGNQSDMVCITRISKDRCVGIRRCRWKLSQPENVRPILLTAQGQLSKDEA